MTKGIVRMVLAALSASAARAEEQNEKKESTCTVNADLAVVGLADEKGSR